MKFLKLIILLPFLLVSVGLRSQEVTVQDAYDAHIELAEQYAELFMYVESGDEWKAAIELARENNLEREYINASISLAELYRSIENYDEAVQILEALDASERYPDLHVRKLGRLAALLILEAAPGDDSSRDIILGMLESALALAIKHDLRLQEATLKNELGFLYRFEPGEDHGLDFLISAASIFREIQEDRHLVRVMINLVNVYQDLKDYERADSVADGVFELMEGKDWYADERDLHDALAYRQYILGDSLQHLIWMLESLRSHQKYLEVTHSKRMAQFRVLQETEKLQLQAQKSELRAEQTEEELRLQQERSRELILYLSVLALLVLGVAGLLFRERSLKMKLGTANAKYQVLMVESNHRIKNNLQMIISMLQFASHGLNEENSRAFDRMSSKIHTVSALHKHLYLDVHNERVDVAQYFNDIIGMYQEMASNELKVEKHIDPVRIKSERIVYFGLILNELLSNTVEHRIDKTLPVYVRIVRVNGHFRFTYSDGSSIVNKEKKGTGTLLVDQLIERVGGRAKVFDASIGQYQFEFNE